MLSVAQYSQRHPSWPTYLLEETHHPLRNPDRPRYRSACVNLTTVKALAATKTAKIIPLGLQYIRFICDARFEPETPPQPRAKREKCREFRRQSFSLLIVWFVGEEHKEVGGIGFLSLILFGFLYSSSVDSICSAWFQ
ncbi:hypothetical protein KFK09_005958 [Dendrobium nobile]|uniref:Uncharacterized protein n=1 Tax=Dendrobium nobile TaxID=94219 RepID=A0A8T3BZQ0_DENNO|nr:hypothetical protein KFK09_005958 [Dendrobium nobile]